jgi:hypothetical protein
VDVVLPKGKKPDPKAAEPVPTANAVRIKGFWRANDRNSNIVYDLLKRLRANPEHFSFTGYPVDEQGKKAKEPVELQEKEIVKELQADPAEEDFAAPFELVIPLSREVPIK